MPKIGRGRQHGRAASSSGFVWLAERAVAGRRPRAVAASPRWRSAPRSRSCSCTSGATIPMARPRTCTAASTSRSPGSTSRTWSPGLAILALLAGWTAAGFFWPRAAGRADRRRATGTSSTSCGCSSSPRCTCRRTGSGTGMNGVRHAWTPLLAIAAGSSVRRRCGSRRCSSPRRSRRPRAIRSASRKPRRAGHTWACGLR